MKIAFGLSLLATALLEILLKPSRSGSFRRLVRNSNAFRQLRFHYLVLQDGPSFDKKSKKVSICYGCPDATIRNGKLSPVCLADRFNPYLLKSAFENIHEGLAQLVFDHLGER